MRRPMVVAVAAVAVLAAGAFAVVAWMTAPSRPAGAEDRPSVPGTYPGGGVASSAGAFPPAQAAPAPAQLPTGASGAGQPFEGWALARFLPEPPEPLVRDVAMPLARCFPGGVRQTPGAPAQLTLRFEARPGGLQVLDAVVAERGDVSAAVVACAQQVFRGRTVATGGFAPGEHVQATYPLGGGAPAAQAPGGQPAPGARPPFKRQRGKGVR